MLTFYTNPRSRGQIARWMLEETDADYSEVVVPYGPEMRTGSFSQINPMGKVPAIVHNDQVVTETPAICAYLADAYPQAELAPPTAERAAYYRWLFFAAGPLEQAITSKSMGWEPDAKQSGMLGFGSFERVVSVLETHLAESAFATGDRFTAADVYLGSQIDFGLAFGTLPARPDLEAYRQRATDREAYRRAKARDLELIAADGDG